LFVDDKRRALTGPRQHEQRIRSRGKRFAAELDRLLR
jgi:hypothetical protein